MSGASSAAIRNPLTIAHRAGNSPELAERAAAVGVDLVESDVWFYRNQIEVRHFKTMGPVPLLWDRWALAPGWTPRLTLEHLMSELREGPELLLDVKGHSEALPRSILSTMRAVAGNRDYSVCSQSWSLLEPFREAAGVRVFHSIGNRRVLAALLAEPERVAPRAISIHQQLLSPSIVERLRAIVPLITTWPVNTLTRAQQLQSWGVNGFTSDSLDVLSALVAARAESSVR